MKLKNIVFFLIINIFGAAQLSAQETNPVVSNVAFSISGTTVTVTYDVSDLEQGTVTISMEVSSDGGTTWNYDYGAASGNIGTSTATGTNKSITWTYSGAYNPNFKIKIYANDETADGSACSVATVDYGGITYHTIQIGDQCWLKENLDIGNMINSYTGGTNSDGQQTDNSVIEKYCYNNTSANCTTYGGLYQWGEAMEYVTTEGTQGICPSGWHIPTLAEFTALKNIVSSDGNSLKATTEGSPPGAGTNTSGFSALLAGFINSGNSSSLGSYIFLLSSTEGSSAADILSLSGSANGIYIYENVNTYGQSVRCIQD